MAKRGERKEAGRLSWQHWNLGFEGLIIVLCFMFLRDFIGLGFLIGLCFGAVKCCLGCFWLAETATLMNSVLIDIFSAAPLLAVSACLWM